MVLDIGDCLVYIDVAISRRKDVPVGGGYCTQKEEQHPKDMEGIFRTAMVVADHIGDISQKFILFCTSKDRLLLGKAQTGRDCFGKFAGEANPDIGPRFFIVRNVGSLTVWLDQKALSGRKLIMGTVGDIFSFAFQDEVDQVIWPYCRSVLMAGSRDRMTEGIDTQILLIIHGHFD